MRKVIFTVILSILSLLFLGRMSHAHHLPSPQKYVNDFAEVLDNNFEEQLEQKIAQYDDGTTNQIALVIIRSLAGESIETYSMHLAEQWKPGTKEKDNGVIFLASINDRRMRIGVGTGVEELLTDIEANRIIEGVKPFFREGQYDAGVTFVVDNVILALGMPDHLAGASGEGDMSPRVVLFITALIIVVIVVLVIAASPYSPLGGQGSWGYTGVWVPSTKSSSPSRSGGSGFGGGGFSGGGSSGSW